MEKSSFFDENADRYEAWYKRNDHMLDSEVGAIKELLPVFQKGVEIGVGTGVFASRLGVRYGVEPVAAMREKAAERGIYVVDGVVEQLPFADGEYDLALLVTVDCFLPDLPRAFREVWRILAPGGIFIVAFIDRDTYLGEFYEQKKKEDSFYQDASFHSAGEMKTYLDAGGFEVVGERQTLFVFENIEQESEPGVGRGGFAVLKAKKR